MMKQLNAVLAENSAAWGLPGDAWNFWVYNNSHPHCTNLDIMWFHGKENFPSVVTKLDRQPNALAREFENLTHVHARIPGYVPRPLNFGRVEGFWALWMEGLPGTPFPGGYSPETLGAIIQMLVSIHSAVREPLVAPGRRQRILKDPLQSVIEFGESEAVRDGCSRLEDSIDDAWIGALPCVPQHGDCYPGNIISVRGEPRLVDWETFRAIDLPFYDLLTLLLSLLVPDGDSLERLDPEIVERSPALIDLYAKGMGLPAPDLRLLLPLVLVNRFHLMRLDGREKFAARAYRLIEHVFEHPDVWEPIVQPALAEPVAGPTRKAPVKWFLRSVGRG